MGIFILLYTYIYMYILILRFVKLRHATLYTRNSNDIACKQISLVITIQINSKISFNKINLIKYIVYINRFSIFIKIHISNNNSSTIDSRSRFQCKINFGQKRHFPGIIKKKKKFTSPIMISQQYNPLPPFLYKFPTRKRA